MSTHLETLFAISEKRKFREIKKKSSNSLFGVGDFICVNRYLKTRNKAKTFEIENIRLWMDKWFGGEMKRLRRRCHQVNSNFLQTQVKSGSFCLGIICRYCQEGEDHQDYPRKYSLEGLSHNNIVTCSGQ